MPATSRMNVPKKGTGPPQKLISRIDFLRDLLKNLPDSLPILDEQHSAYQFGLDYDSLEDRGPLGSFSHSMEIYFKTHQNQHLQITERGPRLHDDLIKMMKAAVNLMSEKDREVFRDAWLERMIAAAVHAGSVGSKAKERKRQRQEMVRGDEVTKALKRTKTAAEVITISDSEDGTGRQDSLSSLSASPSTMSATVQASPHLRSPSLPLAPPTPGTHSSSTSPAPSSIQ
ncbi:hypothetical protein HDZ31DRAFT_69722 [Schizophyllum fasciatum]